MAAQDAAAQLKGTLKYTDDDHTLEEWLELLADDAGDARIYAAFALAKLREEKSSD